MDLVRGFWRKHRRKILVTTTCLGSGYLLYKLYNAHTRKLADLERELAYERENDEIIKTQLSFCNLTPKDRVFLCFLPSLVVSQFLVLILVFGFVLSILSVRMKAHFDNIQMIADTTTLPHAMHHLSSRLVEEIDVSSIMDKLSKGKGILIPSEKLHLWNELKILSFTRMVLSLWSVTMLSLYIRVQVNILGRHLYIDTARGLGSSHLLEELDLIDRDDEQKFLASADFLATSGIPSLISNMQGAVKEVLKGKQLKDVFTTRVLQETVMRILDVFMSTGSPHHWVDYLMMSQDATSDVSSSDATVTKFHQLITETREVVTSNDFTNVAEISLKCCAVALVEEMETQTALAKGMQLAKLLPQIEKTMPEISAEPSKNRFLQLIRDLPEVKLFFTLLYANMPQ
ncbi:peroxisome biogenesis protein 3-1 isoform X1 [Arabidopsis lyrata subsp. lyrata]|uniref:peroxisome biogenesis protein 3-1 isoform X1 n=1 Tax=Arabidopsis lyrata subsp. lyrata TaxID=81972 RepID=UPI000A29BE66|nr:peroxisome biogenesis protein 3-1 isoform X1 [Arabidopsis lyrata subsp. lyrata]|eukprot:XP_020888849.1 peroxisome biogenesis protein 3-1 isoform X1 [Arabidopsis lyrata subsp. lyrata]